MPRPRLLTDEQAEWCATMIALGYAWKIVHRDLEAATGIVCTERTLMRAVLSVRSACIDGEVKPKQAA